VRNASAAARLHDLGWGAKRLSKEFGCARNTVRRYLRAGGVAPFAKPERKSALDGLDDWLRERFFRHAGNADVIRQDLPNQRFPMCYGIQFAEQPRNRNTA
jgi:transposase